MENSNTPLSNEESLAIIQRMVREAQGAIAENGFDYIFWGWLLVAVSIGHYILLSVSTPIDPGMVYLIMPLGGIYMWWRHSRVENHERVKTHIDTLMAYTWGGYGITLFFLLFFTQAAQTSPLPFLLLLTALPTFISGGALKYKPLIFGGASFWLFGAVSYFLPLEGQIAAQAVSMLVGYLIPGYMLLKQSRTANVQRA